MLSSLPTQYHERSSFLSSEPCAESDKNKIMQINGKKEGSPALVPKKEGDGGGFGPRAYPASRVASIFPRPGMTNR